MNSFKSLLGATHLHVLKKMLLVAMLVGFGKLAGAGKEILVAYRYGVSTEVDVYVLVFILATWLPTIWNSLGTHIFVPLFHRLSVEQRRLFNGEFSGALIVFGLVMSLMIWGMSDSIASALSHRHLGDQDSIRFLIRGMTPLLIIGMLISQLNAQLLAEEKHANTLYTGIPSLVLLVTLWVWQGEFSLLPLLAGTLLGYSLQFLVLLTSYRQSDYFAIPRLSFASQGWTGLRTSLGLMLISQVVVSTAPIIDSMVSMTLGEGGVSTLGYATRFLALCLGLGAIAVGRAILPVLAAEKESSVRYRIALKWFFFLFGAGVLTVIVLWWAIPTLVSAMFERGQFSSDDTLGVSIAVQYGLLQIPFYFSGIVLVQLYASEGLYRVLLGSSLVAITLKLASASLLADHYGVAGVTLSSAIMYLGTFIYLAAYAFNQQYRRRAQSGPDR